MKHLGSASWLLLALVLLCGCGGGRPPGPPPSPPSGPPPQALNVAGNWQFSTTSMAGTPAATIAGSIAQSGSLVSGAVHVDGSNCLDRLTTIGLTGTLTGSQISLTSTPVDGQVITLSGGITANDFKGTYTINGGCANGDKGNATGIKVPSMSGILSATLTTSGGQGIQMEAQVTQASISSEGSFGITGTATFFSNVCLSSGTIKSGTFPSPSFIIGTFVSLEIATNNGTLAFLGTVNPAGEISGDYTLSGGTCDHAGTVFLVASPWDY